MKNLPRCSRTTTTSEQTYLKPEETHAAVRLVSLCSCVTPRCFNPCRVGLVCHPASANKTAGLLWPHRPAPGPPYVYYTQLYAWCFNPPCLALLCWPEQLDGEMINQLINKSDNKTEVPDVSYRFKLNLFGFWTFGGTKQEVYWLLENF